MHRFFISTIVASALTVTGISATMAQAGEYRYVQRQNPNQGNEAVAATLAGIAALFIIGKALEGKNDKKHVATPPAPRKHIHTHRQGKRHMKTHPRRSKVMRPTHPGRRHVQRTYSHWHQHSNGVRHIHPHGRGHHRGNH